MVNSGASIYVCYGCLSVIQKLLYLSKSDTVVEILKNANIPRLTGLSFLYSTDFMVLCREVMLMRFLVNVTVF